MRYTYCPECGEFLKLKGTMPWIDFVQCENKHKFEITFGDPIGGSVDDTHKIRKFPKQMKPLKRKK